MLKLQNAECCMKMDLFLFQYLCVLTFAMKKHPSQTFLDHSILSLTVSPELYSLIIVCTLPLSAAGVGVEGGR